jgi:signal transduction histidine kinase
VNQLPRTRAFLLLRYTLIIATAYLLLAEDHFSLRSTLAMFLVAVALASNVFIGRLPDSLMQSMRFTSGVILYDTLWITLALLSSGRFSSEFFFLYFFVLLLAAIGESLRLIVLGACVTCAAYLVGSSAMGVSWASLTSPSLIRIPFLFSAAIFYGYMVERTRREGRRADEAEALAEQLRRTLAEFRILYARAQEADRIKTEMLATVSHELRTPLTSSIGYVELLLDGSYGAIGDDQRQALARVLSASKILQHAISRMLDASRIEFGYEKLICEEFDLNDVFDELRSEFVPPPTLTIRWPQAAGVPPLRTDADKLRAIVRNLVENAVKYTPQGTVTVEASWEERRDEVEIRVTDTGIGIPPAEIENIFEAFRQGSNRNLFGKAGVGLGLYIVQRLVQRLGGEIAVVSRLEEGSVFTARVPRLLHGGDAVAAAEGSSGRGTWEPAEPAPSARPAALQGSREPATESV